MTIKAMLTLFFIQKFGSSLSGESISWKVGRTEILNNAINLADMFIAKFELDDKREVIGSDLAIFNSLSRFGDLS